MSEQIDKTIRHKVGDIIKPHPNGGFLSGSMDQCYRVTRIYNVDTFTNPSDPRNFRLDLEMLNGSNPSTNHYHWRFERI